MQKQDLYTETAKIPWRELQKFFANGTTIYVSPGLDLVEVAWQISCDNRAQIEQWMAAGELGQVSDEQALAWVDADASLWSVVVKPWVLVQPMAQA